MFFHINLMLLIVGGIVINIKLVLQQDPIRGVLVVVITGNRIIYTSEL